MSYYLWILAVVGEKDETFPQMSVMTAVILYFLGLRNSV